MLIQAFANVTIHQLLGFHTCEIESIFKDIKMGGKRNSDSLEMLKKRARLENKVDSMIDRSGKSEFFSERIIKRVKSFQISPILL